MTLLTWPTDLPRFVVDDFQTTQSDGRLRTSMDTGPAKVRLLSTAAPMPVQAVLSVNPDGLARFDRFWADLGQGVAPFLAPDPIFDGRALGDEDGIALADESGVILADTAWWLLQFGGPPQRRRRGVNNILLRLDLQRLP